MKSLDEFILNYEKATNSHDFDRCEQLVDTDAIYYFSDGTFIGINQIRQAFESTWKAIENEVYEIKNVEWLHKEEDIGVCVYDFSWKGIVNGEQKSGGGRGTNVIVKKENAWKMVHEHLSKSP